MEITLENIEIVKNRTGVNYKEAKNALEKANGNIVDAIIIIEDICEQKEKNEQSMTKDKLIEKMKEIVKKGNVSKIVITRKGDTVMVVPLTLGIIGTIAVPWAAIAGTVAAMGFNCEISFITDAGDIISLSEKAEDLYEGTREKIDGHFKK